jgi:hypothetical protein
MNNHMLMCLGYAVMYLDWCFLLGDAIGNLGIQPATPDTNFTN